MFFFGFDDQDKVQCRVWEKYRHLDGFGIDESYSEAQRVMIEASIALRCVN